MSIPQSVTTIGYQAFSYDFKLTTINVPAGISYAGGTDPSQSFDCTVVSPMPSSTFLGTICNAPSTKVITSNTPILTPTIQPSGQPLRQISPAPSQPKKPTTGSLVVYSVVSSFEANSVTLTYTGSPA